MTDIREQLQAPFPYEQIEWRAQSCGVNGSGKSWVMVLAYVQARAIQKRLDDVFGWDGWTDEYRSTEGNMICRLGVKSEHGWIYKENGASETAMEAFKGGISGAFKRVAASGYGIGRYLYDLKESFAECTLEKPKNMAGWKKAQTKDKKHTIYWKTPDLPLWALPQIEKIELQEVVSGWKELGGTEEQLDNLIMEKWKVTRDQLQQSHLAKINIMLNNKKNGQKSNAG